MQEKGHCKHGKFIIRDGCPQCIAERQAEEGNTEAGIAEAVKVASQTAEPPPTREEVKRYMDERKAVGADSKPFHKESWMEDKPEPAAETALALRPGEDVEAHGYYEEALKLLGYARGRVIATLEDNKAANDDLVFIRKLKRVMEAKRKSLLEPLEAQKVTIRDTYNYLMAPFIEADKVTSDKMLAYDAEQRRIRAKQEEINRKRQEAAEAEMKLTGELSESVNLVEVIPEPAKSVSTEIGTSGMRDTWKWEVVDFSLVPDDYKMINAGVLTPIVKASRGKISIPGIRIFNEPTIAVNVR